jgi:osmotically-inducible protein OsmY
MNEDTALTRDMAIMEKVEQALEANAITASTPFEIEAEGATIIVRGEVASQQAKETAERIARGVAGVLDVVNEVVVSNAAGDDR